MAPLRSIRRDKIEDLYAYKTIILNDNHGNADGIYIDDGGRAPTNQNEMTALDSIKLYNLP